jgi:hypothetical protein
MENKNTFPILTLHEQDGEHKTIGTKIYQQILEYWHVFVCILNFRMIRRPSYF